MDINGYTEYKTISSNTYTCTAIHKTTLHITSTQGSMLLRVWQQNDIVFRSNKLKCWYYWPLGFQELILKPVNIYKNSDQPVTMWMIWLGKAFSQHRTLQFQIENHTLTHHKNQMFPKWIPIPDYDNSIKQGLTLKNFLDFLLTIEKFWFLLPIFPIRDYTVWYLFRILH